MISDYPIPLVGICAYSGTGKTTLLAQLLPYLREHGLRVGVVKHAHCQFDIDKPGKDSHTLRKAGAEQILVASKKRTVLIQEFDDDHGEPTLADALSGIDANMLDLLLVEGFKHEAFPKIELHRPSHGAPLIHPNDPYVIAVATDAPAPVGGYRIPHLDLNRIEQIAEFIMHEIVSLDAAPKLRARGGQ